MQIKKWKVVWKYDDNHMQNSLSRETMQKENVMSILIDLLSEAKNIDKKCVWVECIL